MAKFLLLVMIIGILGQVSAQNRTAEEIKDQLKSLIGQEAKLYETKLTLLKQLQSLQSEVTQQPTAPSSVVTVTRIVGPLAPTEFTSPLALSSTSTGRPETKNDILTASGLETTRKPASRSNAQSVPDVVSYSEVRVDSPTIIILKGRKPALIRT